MLEFTELLTFHLCVCVLMRNREARKEKSAREASAETDSKFRLKTSMSSRPKTVRNTTLHSDLIKHLVSWML